MRYVHRVLFGLVLVFTFDAARLHAAVFTPLGDLAGGAFHSEANGVSSDGLVVVGLGTNASVPTATRWTSGSGMVSLGIAGDLATATDASSNGNVIVGFRAFNDEILGTLNAAFRWTPGGHTFIPNLPGATGGDNTQALGVSADGSVVVGSSKTAGSEIEAYRWASSTGTVGLGRPSGGASVATDVSASGSVVVGYQTSSIVSEAFRWTAAGGRQGLGSILGTAISGANAVSGDGLTIVGSANFVGTNEAFRLVGDQVKRLGDLPGGAFNSNALDASEDGSIIVGAGTVASGLHAFLWNGAMYDLHEALTANIGAPLSGWTLTSATGVSADGRTVVGNGINASGFTESWRARLVDMKWKSPNNGSWDSVGNWDLPFLPDAVDNVNINPSSAVSIAGPSKDTTIASLVIGAGAGRATLQVAGANGGNLYASSVISISTKGELVLADGRSATSPIFGNFGIIRGNGTIGPSITNWQQGKIRVAAGDVIAVPGSLSNFGEIQAIGGTLNAVGTANNFTDGLIFAQNGTLHCENGLANEGSIVVNPGSSAFTGDLFNANTGSILVTGGGAATFYDDVTNDGVITVRKIDNTSSVAVFLGSFTGSGSTNGGGDLFFEGDLHPGSSPAVVSMANNVIFGSEASLNIELGGAVLGTEYDQLDITGDLTLDGTLAVSLIGDFEPASGQVFNILDWTGTLTGAFASLALPTIPGLAWDTSQLYVDGTLRIEEPGLPGDFNHDGAVNAADNVVWRKGIGVAPTPENYNLWRTNFGRTVGGGNGMANAVVPEPTCLLSVTSATILIGSSTRNLRRRHARRK